MFPATSRWVEMRERKLGAPAMARRVVELSQIRGGCLGLWS